MMMKSVTVFLLAVTAFGWSLGTGAAELSAQSPALSEVRDALAEARYPEARTLLEGWWDTESGVADRRTRQEALWLRARLAPDPQVAELDYRRLVIEFPGGAYSDGALLRLAQGAEARGEPETARNYLQILVRDYPASEHRVEARDRMARLPAVGAPDERGNQGDRDASDALPPPVADADTAMGADAAVQDTVTAVETSTVRDDTATTIATPPELEVEAAPEEHASEGVEDADALSGAYTIQLGAFSTSERAEALADRARSAGLSVRVVQVVGSNLFRVRQGGFETRSAAEAAAQAPRDLGFEALVSVDREAERSPD